MKIIKKIDNSNRVVLPTGLRELLDVRAGDDVEFVFEGNKVYIKKASEAMRKNRKQIAAEVLREYGYAVPEELQ